MAFLHENSLVRLSVWVGCGCCRTTHCALSLEPRCRSQRCPQHGSSAGRATRAGAPRRAGMVVRLRGVLFVFASRLSHNCLQQVACVCDILCRCSHQHGELRFASCSLTKIGTIQRRLAWPLCKDDTIWFESVQPFFFLSLRLQRLGMGAAQRARAQRRLPSCSVVLRASPIPAVGAAACSIGPSSVALGCEWKK